jgi:hypothetical protein
MWCEKGIALHVVHVTPCARVFLLYSVLMLLFTYVCRGLLIIDTPMSSDCE